MRMRFLVGRSPRSAASAEQNITGSANSLGNEQECHKASMVIRHHAYRRCINRVFSTGLYSMTKSSARLSLTFDARSKNLPLTLSITIALSVVIGILLIDSTYDLLAYLLVVLASTVPAALWIKGGASGIPTMPAVS